MQPILIIAKRELQSYFNSLTAYILLVVYLIICGTFTWLVGTTVFERGQADLDVFLDKFSIPNFALFVFIPALTMGLLAEEKKTGTIELLLTKSISDRQLVLGKFVGVVGLLFAALIATLPYYITIANIGEVDHGAIISGYAAIFLMAISYASLGLFTSSITNNQIIAFLLALIINFVFHVGLYYVSFFSKGDAGLFIRQLSVPYHYDSLARGVLDLRDLIYFFTLIATGIVLSELSLAKRNINK